MPSNFTLEVELEAAAREDEAEALEGKAEAQVFDLGVCDWSVW